MRNVVNKCLKINSTAQEEISIDLYDYLLPALHLKSLLKIPKYTQKMIRYVINR